MSVKKSQKCNSFVKIVLSLILSAFLVIPVLADTASDLQAAKSLKNELEAQVARSEEILEELQSGAAELEARMDEIDAEIENINSVISLYDEKEAELQSEIDSLNDQIEKEEADIAERYSKMKLRIQYMYENVADDYMDAIFSSRTIGELFKKLQYIFDLNNYDSEMMDQLEAAVSLLEENKASLEANMEDVKYLKTAQLGQRDVLQGLYEAKYAELQDTMEGIEGELSQISSIKESLEANSAEISALSAQYEAEQAQSQAAASESSSVSKTDSEKGNEIISSAASDSTTGGSEYSGSASGQDVVNYALQFVGNPYVWGGTSLTNGADCSGFVMSVYAHFGVSLPHSSYSQRSCGREVSVSDVQPGDIICYNGHVALYIGDGKIVHASTSSTGIIVSNNFQYTTIITIRRIF